MERQHSDLCFLKHGCLADLAAVPLDLPLPFGKTMLPVMLPVIVWAKQGSQERPIPAQGRAPLKSVLGLRTCEPVTTLSRAIFCRWPSYWPPGKRYHSPLTHFFSSKDGSFPQNHQNFSYNKLDSRIISAVNFKELWTKCHHPETRKREIIEIVKCGAFCPQIWLSSHLLWEDLTTQSTISRHIFGTCYSSIIQTQYKVDWRKNLEKSKRTYALHWHYSQHRSGTGGHNTPWSEFQEEPAQAGRLDVRPRACQQTVSPDRTSQCLVTGDPERG